MRKLISVCCTLLFLLLVTSCADKMEVNNNFTSETDQTESIESFNSTAASYADETVEESFSSDASAEKETMVASCAPTDNSEEAGETLNEYTLIVIEQDITQGNSMIFYENPTYVALPFNAVMKALGAVIERKSKDIFEIIFNGETYVLDTSTISLVKAGSNTNFIIPAPGSKVYYQIVEEEFVIDHITLKTITMMMGIKLRIQVDYQQHSVVINYQ